MSDFAVELLPGIALIALSLLTAFVRRPTGAQSTGQDLSPDKRATGKGQWS